MLQPRHSVELEEFQPPLGLSGGEQRLVDVLPHSAAVEAPPCNPTVRKKGPL